MLSAAKIEQFACFPVTRCFSGLFREGAAAVNRFRAFNRVAHVAAGKI